MDTIANVTVVSVFRICPVRVPGFYLSTKLGRYILLPDISATLPVFKTRLIAFAAIVEFVRVRLSLPVHTNVSFGSWKINVATRSRTCSSQVATVWFTTGHRARDAAMANEDHVSSHSRFC